MDSIDVNITDGTITADSVNNNVAGRVLGRDDGSSWYGPGVAEVAGRVLGQDLTQYYDALPIDGPGVHVAPDDPAWPGIGAILWGVLNTALTTVGSIGKLVYDRLVGLVAPTLTVASPVATSGTITVYAGDDYSAADQRSLTLTLATTDDLTGGVPHLRFAGLDWTGDLSTTNPNTWALVWHPTAEDTGALHTTMPYPYTVRVLRDGRVLTEATGTIRVEAR
jgi:hypothetical protein